MLPELRLLSCDSQTRESCGIMASTNLLKEVSLQLEVGVRSSAVISLDSSSGVAESSVLIEGIECESNTQSLK